MVPILLSGQIDRIIFSKTGVVELIWWLNKFSLFILVTNPYNEKFINLSVSFLKIQKFYIKIIK